jgi:mono/diheme cytochrome c family protein
MTAAAPGAFMAVLLASLLLALPAHAPAQAKEAQEAPVTTLDGVYTAEQAARGRLVYQRSCVGCHALDWYQGEVVRAWEGAPVFGLYEIIRTRMPEDNPGSLSRRQYADVLAYILELNGMPVGEQELSTGASRLRQILFQWGTDP